MMERFLLGLLFLSGWKSSSSLLRQYHYVIDLMTWTDAQTYCRNTFKDLYTFENADETNAFLYTFPWSSSYWYFWIGLRSKIEWKWSDGFKESGAGFRPWKPAKEPDFFNGDQYCVVLDESGEWGDESCSQKYPFICYNGTSENPEFFLVDGALDWTGAQSHCRKNYKDLATVRNDAENQNILGLMTSHKWLWIGLYRDPDDVWSDGTVSTYRNWRGSPFLMGNSTVLCVVADMRYSGKWRLEPCDAKHSSMCYTAPSKKQGMKLKIKVEDSVDMNDPVVKAEILKKLQDKLKQDGLSGFTLRWREQPDGKVFHKEETCPQKKNDANFPQCG